MRIIFNGSDAAGLDAARDQRGGERTGAWAQLEKTPTTSDIELRRHRTAERFARRRNGAGPKRMCDGVEEETGKIGKRTSLTSPLWRGRNLQSKFRVWSLHNHNPHPKNRFIPLRCI